MTYVNIQGVWPLSRDGGRGAVTPQPHASYAGVLKEGGLSPLIFKCVDLYCMPYKIKGRFKEGLNEKHSLRVKFSQGSMPPDPSRRLLALVLEAPPPLTFAEPFSVLALSVTPIFRD